jgi:hypothetical protein
VNILARLKTLISDTDPASEESFDDLMRHGLQAVGGRRLDDRRVGVRSRSDDVDRHRELTGAEQVWLAKHLSESVRFVETHGAIAGQVFDPAVLDAAFTGWNGCSIAEREEERVVVNALGTAFGQWLVDTQGMTWVVMIEDDGEDFGVNHDRIGLTVAPLTIAARRMQSGMEDFFSVLGRLIKREIQRGSVRSMP